MEGTVTIYALCDEAGALRYVGRTSGPLDLRLRQHVSDGGRSAKHAWLARMASSRLRPAIIALEVVSSPEANAAERRHIARLQQEGAALTNAAVQLRTRLSPGVVVRLTEQCFEKLQRLAARQELPVAVVARRLLNERLDEMNDE